MTNAQLTDKILEWLEAFQARPGMFIWDNLINYDTTSQYISTYLTGIGHAFGLNLERSVIRWYEMEKTVLISCSLSAYIKIINPNKSEQELTVMLFDVVKKFFLQNPNWQDRDIIRTEEHYNRVLKDV